MPATACVTGNNTQELNNTSVSKKQLESINLSQISVYSQGRHDIEKYISCLSAATMKTVCIIITHYTPNSYN